MHGKWKFTKRMMGSLVFFCLGLVSLSTVTYAWFSTTRTASVNVQNIKVAGPESAEIYQYKGNYTLIDGVKNYDGWNYAQRATRTFSSFANDFEACDSLQFSYLSPSTAYTFAFRLSKGSSATTNISLSSFTCTLGHDGTDESGNATTVYLSEAIDFFCSSYDYTDVGDDTLSSQALAHLQNDNLMTDSFTASGASGGNVSLYSHAYSGSSMLVFMSLVVSNDSSSYYSYNATTSRYVKNVAGNSNVYKGLDITFGGIAL